MKYIFDNKTQTVFVTKEVGRPIMDIRDAEYNEKIIIYKTAKGNKALLATKIITTKVF